MKCRNKTCVGFNENKNMFNGARQFTTYLLPHGAPTSLRPLVDQLVDGFSNLTMTVDQLLMRMSQVVDSYSSGKYLNRTLGLNTHIPCK